MRTQRRTREWEKRRNGARMSKCEISLARAWSFVVRDGPVRGHFVRRELYFLTARVSRSYLSVIIKPRVILMLNSLFLFISIYCFVSVSGRYIEFTRVIVKIPQLSPVIAECFDRPQVGSQWIHTQESRVQWAALQSEFEVCVIVVAWPPLTLNLVTK